MMDDAMTVMVTTIERRYRYRPQTARARDTGTEGATIESSFVFLRSSSYAFDDDVDGGSIGSRDEDDDFDFDFDDFDARR
jgi:hypothetical protein